MTGPGAATDAVSLLCVSDPGDMNGDGVIDAADIGDFVAVLLDAGSASYLTDLDCDGDGDGVDVALFLDRVLAPEPKLNSYGV